MVKGDRPWYGRTVIRSCCKLDYGTAQNMLDGTIKPSDKEISSDLWDLERRPSDGHTIEQVVNDVKFLGLVALARRKKRFDSGALALNKTKLSFVLDKKSGNPTGMRAYPIRKSNNLVEEYMLLANFLVAQRLLQAYVLFERSVRARSARIFNHIPRVSLYHSHVSLVECYEILNSNTTLEQIRKGRSLTPSKSS